MSIAFPVLLLIIGAALLWGRGTLSLVVAALFLVVGVYIGSTWAGDYIRSLIGALTGAHF